MKNEKTVGITGASGSLGKELTKLFRQKGYKVIGFTHSKTDSEINLESPNEWIKWECGKEALLKKHLKNIDILIVASGSVSLGKIYLNIEKKKLRIHEKQACAACGQAILMNNFKKTFEKKKLTVAQILLTYSDTEDRKKV